MSAPTYTRSPRPASAGVEVRLPWWAIALPSVAFASLLLMMVGSGQAHAATDDPAIGQLLQRIVDLLAR
ncbi:hypothetical protein AB0N06_19675 [Streptomyces sp. NPDC051020]|uniref:hypothetical protein n=1 Tax=Streptomyces sp. NPDC051020 TaxID=3155409 RepID=UPI003436C237